jgi:hypothetical protein
MESVAYVPAPSGVEPNNAERASERAKATKWTEESRAAWKEGKSPPALVARAAALATPPPPTASGALSGTAAQQLSRLLVASLTGALQLQASAVPSGQASGKGGRLQLAGAAGAALTAAPLAARSDSEGGDDGDEGGTEAQSPRGTRVPVQLLATVRRTGSQE